MNSIPQSFLLERIAAIHIFYKDSWANRSPRYPSLSFFLNLDSVARLPPAFCACEGKRTHTIHLAFVIEGVSMLEIFFHMEELCVYFQEKFEILEWPATF